MRWFGLGAVGVALLLAAFIVDTRTRGVARAALRVVVSIGLFAVTAEAAVSAWLAWGGRGVEVGDPGLGPPDPLPPWDATDLGRSPVALRFTSWDHPLGADPDTLRVLFLGDSYTAATGVATPFAFTTVVDELLTADPPDGRRVEVLNHGMAGMSLLDEVALYGDYSVHYAPDVVVLVFALNDLGGETLRVPDWADDRDGDFILDPTWRGFGTGSLHAWDFATRALRQRRVTRAMEQGYRDVFTEDAPTVGTLRDVVTRLAKDVHGRGARLVVAGMPLLHRLSDYPFEAAHAQVGRVVTEAGAAWVDLLPEVAGDDERDLWASAEDHHPGVEGNRRFGVRLARAIREGVPEASPVSCEPPPATLQEVLASAEARDWQRGEAQLRSLVCHDPASPDTALAWARARIALRVDPRGPFNAWKLVKVALHEANARAWKTSRRSEVLQSSLALLHETWEVFGLRPPADRDFGPPAAGAARDVDPEEVQQVTEACETVARRLEGLLGAAESNAVGNTLGAALAPDALAALCEELAPLQDAELLARTKALVDGAR